MANKLLVKRTGPPLFIVTSYRYLQSKANKIKPKRNKSPHSHHASDLYIQHLLMIVSYIRKLSASLHIYAGGFKQGIKGQEAKDRMFLHHNFPP